MKVDSYFLIKFRNCLYPLLMWLSKCKVKYQIKIINEYVPIIFAVNHQAFQDTPIALKATKRRSYIYAGKQKLYGQQILHRRTVILEKLKKEMYKVVAEYPPFNQAYETPCIYYSGRY